MEISSYATALALISARVRTILVLGTGQYSQVLDSTGIGGYFLSFWPPIQYQSGTSQHRPHCFWLVLWQMQSFVWTRFWYAAVYYTQSLSSS